MSTNIHYRQTHCGERFSCSAFNQSPNIAERSRRCANAALTVTCFRFCSRSSFVSDESKLPTRKWRQSGLGFSSTWSSFAAKKKEEKKNHLSFWILQHWLIFLFLQFFTRGYLNDPEWPWLELQCVDFPIMWSRGVSAQKKILTQLRNEKNGRKLQNWKRKDGIFLQKPIFGSLSSLCHKNNRLLRQQSWF